MIHLSVNNFNINNKTIYSKYFSDTCPDILLKMRSLKSPNLEIWNYLNNEFSFQIGAYNTFPRIAMDQAIEEKSFNHRQTPTGTKG